MMRKYEAKFFLVAKKFWIKKEAKKYATKAFQVVINSLEATSKDVVPFFRTEKIKIEGAEEFDKLDEDLKELVGEDTDLYREISEKTESILVKKLRKIGWEVDEDSNEAYIKPIVKK